MSKTYYLYMAKPTLFIHLSLFPRLSGLMIFTVENEEIVKAEKVKKSLKPFK